MSTDLPYTAHLFREQQLFSQEQVLEFLSRYPAFWLVIPILGAFAIYRKYRRTKRRLEHINDPQSKVMLVVGFIGAAILIALLLAYS